MAPFLKKPVCNWHLSGPDGPLFNAKRLNIIFCAPKCAPNCRKWPVAFWLNWTEQQQRKQIAQIREHLAALEEGTGPDVIDV